MILLAINSGATDAIGLALGGAFSSVMTGNGACFAGAIGWWLTGGELDAIIRARDVDRRLRHGVCEWRYEASMDMGVGEGALGDRLVDELQRRILDGTVPVGSWLRHDTLAQEFGVSRTPVREALRVLNARGIVTIVPNRGAQVNGHSSRELRELGEVRAELEGFAAELAVDRIDDDQLARMQNAIEDFAAAINDYTLDPARSKSAEASARWSAANAAFHGAILDGSGNLQLELSIEDIGRRLPRNSSFPVYSGNLHLLRQNLAEHQAVADAIVARDARKARAAMIKHLRSASASRIRYLEAQERIV